MVGGRKRIAQSGQRSEGVVQKGRKEERNYDLNEDFFERLGTRRRSKLTMDFRARRFLRPQSCFRGGAARWF